MFWKKSNKVNVNKLVVDYRDLNIPSPDKDTDSLSILKGVHMVMRTLKMVARRNNQYLFIVAEHEREDWRPLQAVMQYADHVTVNGKVIKNRWPGKLVV
jgi:hypothetical protein